MNKEEKEAIEYFEHKIKNKLPLYEETYVDGKPYRRNILQLETNFTEEQANKTQIVLNLIDKLQKENEELKNNQLWSKATIEGLKERFIPKDKIRDKIKELEKYSNIDQFSIFTETKIDILKELLGE